MFSVLSVTSFESAANSEVLTGRRVDGALFPTVHTQPALMFDFDDGLFMSAAAALTGLRRSFVCCLMFSKNDGEMRRSMFRAVSTAKKWL